MATSTVPMDDRELFDAAMSNEPQEAPQEAPVEETRQDAETQQRERDDKGRFVAKTETEQPEQAEQPVQQQAPAEQEQNDQTGQVPAWRLRELREARDAAERKANEEVQQRYAVQQQMLQLQNELAALRKPKADPVDFFSNPDEAFQQRVAPIEERFAQLESKLRLNTSRALAVATHGAQAVSEMEAAVEKASQQGHPDLPGLAAQMRNSDDPVGLAMRWHKQTTLLDKTGGDLDAFIQKQLDEKLKDPAVQARVLEMARASANIQSRPNVQIPPSLNKAPGAGGMSAQSENSDMSDASLYAYATAPGKR